MVPSKEKPIEMAIPLNEGICLSIKENPSTGFTLIVDDSNTDIYSMESRYEPFENFVVHPLAGAGGVRIFDIIGKKVGEAPFRAVNARSWEYDHNFENFKGT